MSDQEKTLKDINGNDIPAQVVEISTLNEEWNKYTLEDGTNLKVKFVVTEVIKLKDQFDPSGNPVYFIQGQAVINTNSPAELRKKV